MDTFQFLLGCMRVEYTCSISYSCKYVKLTLDIFLTHSPFYILRQSFSLEPRVHTLGMPSYPDYCGDPLSFCLWRARITGGPNALPASTPVLVKRALAFT